MAPEGEDVTESVPVPVPDGTWVGSVVGTAEGGTDVGMTLGDKPRLVLEYPDAWEREAETELVVPDVTVTLVA